jgi:hypothetical protein
MVTTSIPQIGLPQTIPELAVRCQYSPARGPSCAKHASALESGIQGLNDRRNQPQTRETPDPSRQRVRRIDEPCGAVSPENVEKQVTPHSRPAFAGTGELTALPKGCPRPGPSPQRVPASRRCTNGLPSDAVIVFPDYALLVVEERLKEQQAGGVHMPPGVPLDELALRVLISAAVLQEPSETVPLDRGTRSARDKGPRTVQDRQDDPGAGCPDSSVESSLNGSAQQSMRQGASRVEAKRYQS